MLKEDVLAFIESGRKPTSAAHAAPTDTQAPPAEPRSGAPAKPSAAPTPARPATPSPMALAEDVKEPITGIRSSMVKSMTAALRVPHFGYADEVTVPERVGQVGRQN